MARGRRPTLIMKSKGSYTAGETSSPLAGDIFICKEKEAAQKAIRSKESGREISLRKRELNS